RIFRKRHLLEARLALDRRQRDRFRKRLHCLDVDCEKHSLLVGGIVIALADHRGDADDLLLLAGVIEQGVLALLHLLQVPAGGESCAPRPPPPPLPPLCPYRPRKKLRARFSEPKDPFTPPSLFPPP